MVVGWLSEGCEQRFPYRERASEYSGLFPGSLLEKIKRSREALVVSRVGDREVLRSCHIVPTGSGGDVSWLCVTKRRDSWAGRHIVSWLSLAVL